MSSRIPERRQAPPAPGSHNLFFALWPADAVRAGIAAAASNLRHEIAPAGRWVAASRYHLTLQFLGNHAAPTQGWIARVRAAGDAVEAAPFELALDTLGSFGHRSIPWWLGCGEVPSDLRDLWSKLGVALRKADVAMFGASTFVPHVTILRDAKASATRAIAPIAWPVDSFALVDSVLGANSTYTILHRWRLCPR